MMAEQKQGRARRRYMVVGGGSGGHITPLLAVAVALKSREPEAVVQFVGQVGEDLSDVLDHEAIDATYAISAGKFRRYHGESVWAHLRDYKTIWLNFRDFFRFLKGLYDAWRLLGDKTKRPDAIFLKGGFVCVPIGYVARRKNIPYITHDSDAVPGLANRLTAKHAVYNTTAMPADFYPYDASKTRAVGIPLRTDFSLVTDAFKKQAKSTVGISADSPVVLLTGGGNGSQGLNDMLIACTRELMNAYPKLHIIHLSGKKLVAETQRGYEQVLDPLQRDQVQVHGFYGQLHVLSAAADVVIARAGATTVAELAVQAKPCVFVPSPFLTGGQQLHNARVLSESNAAVIVDEDDVTALQRAVVSILGNPQEAARLSSALNGLARADAADAIAVLLSGAASDTQAGRASNA